MPGVGQHRVVGHPLEVLAAQHVARAGDGDEDLAALGGLERRHDLEALHARLERAHRIDLADDDAGPRAPGALRDAAAGPAVAEHDDGAPGEEEVRRAQDAVERRLAGAVAVVERALGLRLVHGQDRAVRAALGLHRAHPQQAGRRLLGRAAQRGHGVGERGVHDADEVGAVVERDVGPGGRERGDVLGPRVGALAVDGEHRGGAVGCASAAATSSCVASGLAAQSATFAPPTRSVRTSTAVSAVTCRHAATATPSSGRSVGEARADRPEDGHLPVRPADPRLALGRQSPGRR